MKDVTWGLDFLGDSAVVLRAPQEDAMAANAAVHRMARRVRTAVSGVRDVVPGMRDVVVHVDPLRCDVRLLARLAAQPESGEDASIASAATDPFEVPVTYGGSGGPDLADVARDCGLSADEVVRRHLAGDYQVCFIGFLPGFAYLGPLDPALRVPRRPIPRPKVTPGAVAVAGEYTGIYPWESPGGWHLIGHTDVSLFDLAQDPPARLAPGTRVRFVPA